MRVLTCDDVADLRFLIRMTLNAASDVEVVGEAENGAEAIERSRELQPDVVLLDLAMPVMDGMTAIPHILEASPNTRIVVLSGFDEAAMEARAVAAGASAYIRKGTGIAHLIDTLRTLNERSPPTDHAEEPLRAMANVIAAIELMPGPAVLVDANGLVRLGNADAHSLLGHVAGAPAEKVFPGLSAADSAQVQTKQGLVECDVLRRRVRTFEGGVTILRILPRPEPRGEGLYRGLIHKAVGHDLRSPLVSILGFADFLRDPPEDRESRNEMVDAIVSSARRIEHTIDNIQDFERAQESRLVCQRAPTDLAGVIADAVRFAGLGSREVTVNLVVGLFDVDPRLFDRIVDLLLRNIAKHTPGDTHVWIETRPVDGGVELSVVDSGPGCAPERLPTVFEAPVAHSGFGLYLVRCFADLHGGRVRADNRNEGGFVVRVFLAEGGQSAKDSDS